MSRIDAAVLRRWQDVVTQAMACIKGETPEDVSFGEAEDDTFSKLRQVDSEIAAALTAAAEVGPIEKGGVCLLHENTLDPATIKRCAKIAENVAWHKECGKEIAAAIRAQLKDGKCA